MCNLELSREPRNCFSISVSKECQPMHLSFILHPFSFSCFGGRDFMICRHPLLIHSTNNKGINVFWKDLAVWYGSLCSSVLFLDCGERSMSGLFDCVISAGLRPHQLNRPRLPGERFNASAVLIRAAGEESRFHSRRLRNVLCQESWSAAWSAATCSATEIFPHPTATEMSSFPVNVYNSLGFYMFYLAVRLSITIIT